MYLVFRSKNTQTLFPVLYWKEAGGKAKALLEQTLVYYKNPEFELAGVVDDVAQERAEKSDKEKELEQKYVQLQQETASLMPALTSGDETISRVAHVRARMLMRQIDDVAKEIARAASERGAADRAAEQQALRENLKEVPADVLRELQSHLPMIGEKEILGFYRNGRVTTGTEGAALYKQATQ